MLRPFILDLLEMLLPAAIGLAMFLAGKKLHRLRKLRVIRVVTGN